MNPGQSIGYLGPRGTFTEEALEKNFSGQYQSVRPFPTVSDALRAAHSGSVDCAMVPIENSIEGSVNATIDTLAYETELKIEREALLRVVHKLLVRPGVKTGDITMIVSHPQATAQCSLYLHREFPGIPVTAANSTAEAALQVSRSGEPLAAIASETAALIYGLEVLDGDMEDHRGNITRFIVAGRNLPPPSGRDKTSVVCFIHENRPGSLLEILKEFAAGRINLTRIESRPTGKALGEYCFFIDFEGHLEDEPVKPVVRALKAILRELKFLGSYPAATPLSLK